MQVFRYDSVESTNETAKRLIRERGFAGPAYVVAREQTAGKGTRGRKWASPRDAGIYLSVIETPEAFCTSEVEATAFTLAAGVACVECLRRQLGIPVELKPINDLYVHGRKLGGILTEAIIERGRVTALITGIGINVLCAERSIAPAKSAATSLQELLEPATMRDLNMDALAEAIATDAHTLNLAVLRGEIEQVRWAWERYRISDGDAVRG